MLNQQIAPHDIATRVGPASSKHGRARKRKINLQPGKIGNFVLCCLAGWLVARIIHIHCAAKLAYMETHVAIQASNDIFGPNGWSMEIRDVRIDVVNSDLV